PSLATVTPPPCAPGIVPASSDIARSAVDHRPRRGTSCAQIGAQLGRCRGIDIVAVQIRTSLKDDTIMGLRRRRRYAALCHIARHQFYLALEWIAPAAAASRDHAHHLPR